MLDWIRWCQNINHGNRGSFSLGLKNEKKIFCASLDMKKPPSILTWLYSNLLFESEGQEISVDNLISYIFQLNTCSG